MVHSTDYADLARELHNYPFQDTGAFTVTFRISYDNYAFVETSLTPQRRLTIYSCHEAAHAIAAYHFRFPFYRVRLQLGQDNVPLGGALCPDQAAWNIARLKLYDGGLDGTPLHATTGSVFKIGKFANIRFNHVNPSDANFFAQNDDDDYQNLLQGLNAGQRADILERVLALVNSLVGNPHFPRALERLATALANQREMNDEQVAAVIRDAVGVSLDGPWIEMPSFHSTQLAAFDRFVARGCQHGDDWGDWFTAERAQRYLGTLVRREGQT